MRAAIYCRLSEEDRNKQSQSDDSASIQNQKAMLLAYAAQQGWEVSGIYSDDDYTGSDRRRPAFNRLLRDAQQRQFEVILCKTQSRFTRELELVEKYIHGLFPIWGIRFVSIVDNADTANKGNKKSRQINGLVNEWYLEDMSENIRSVLTSRRLGGFHIGAFALYGYRKDPNQKGHLLIDEEAAAVVREVFTLFSGGYGKTAIARLLNERGIPNPTEYKRLHGLRYRQPGGRNSTLWKYGAISDMLTNEIYIGNMVQGKYGSVSYKTKQNRPRPRESWYIVPGTHEPIIDRELWDRVQRRIAQRAKPFAGGTIGPFAGIARCANCGYAMRSSKTRGRHYLQCPSRYIAKEACIGSFIAVDWLEQLVLSELRRLTEAYLDTEALAKSLPIADDFQAQRKSLCSELKDCQRKIDEYTEGIGALYIDRIRGELRESDYRAMHADFEKKRANLETLAAQRARELEALEETARLGDRRMELAEQYLHPAQLTREMSEILIERISVGKRKKGEKHPPVEIYWNF